MSADWKAGDKALCVEDDWNVSHHDASELPKKGTIYLVRDVRLDARGDVGLYLVGPVAFNAKAVFRFFKKRTTEAGWSARHFRKIVPACDRAEIHNEATL